MMADETYPAKSESISRAQLQSCLTGRDDDSLISLTIADGVSSGGKGGPNERAYRIL